MKKVIALVFIILIVGVTWYLFIKPNDYIVRFNAPTTVGTVNQAIKSWQLTKQNIKLIPSGKLNLVQQKNTYGDSTHIYTWEIKQLTDSTSKVILGIKDETNSISNRLKIPFGNTFIQERSEAVAKDFYNGLKDHLDSFKVTLEGQSVTAPSYVAYVSIEGTQLQKAGGMMKYYGYLNSIMTQDGIEAKGTPFIEVTQWDQTKDSIHYNFCFPIKNRANLPDFPEVQYKRIFEKKALKATYNGNYITSDRAWYRLLAYAQENNIEVDPLPIEVFYNNPNYGGNEKDWKAEIYMPLKE